MLGQAMSGWAKRPRSPLYGHLEPIHTLLVSVLTCSCARLPAAGELLGVVADGSEKRQQSLGGTLLPPQPGGREVLSGGFESC